jgi:hypothetical protein
MMLHQDGSRHAWLAGNEPMDLIVTMDDATNEIYSAFLVEEEGTASTFRALVDVLGAHGVPLSLYIDRGSRYFHTPEAGGPVDRANLTQVGRALAQLSRFRQVAQQTAPRFAASTDSDRQHEREISGYSKRRAAGRLVSSGDITRSWGGGQRPSRSVDAIRLDQPADR